MTARTMIQESGQQGRMILIGSDCGEKDILISLKQTNPNLWGCFNDYKKNQSVR